MFRHTAANIHSYLRHHVRDMESNLRFTPGQVAADVTCFLLWVMPSALFVIAVDWLGAFKDTSYLTKAIGEGMSVTLMDVFATFAFSLFGAVLLAPRLGMLIRAARQMFINTFSIGSLNYGLLLGFCIVSLGSFSTVQTSLLMTGFLLLIPLHLALLYFYSLCSPESQNTGFLAWWSGKPLPFRAPIALIIIVGPLAFLLAQS